MTKAEAEFSVIVVDPITITGVVGDWRPVSESTSQIWAVGGRR
jgi:hypothetical protein